MCTAYGHCTVTYCDTHILFFYTFFLHINAFLYSVSYSIRKTDLIFEQLLSHFSTHNTNIRYIFHQFDLFVVFDMLLDFIFNASNLESLLNQMVHH